MAKRKEKEFDAVAYAGKLRREQEIKEHGKQIWLRKGGVHESIKAYKRSVGKRVEFDY